MCPTIKNHKDKVALKVCYKRLSADKVDNTWVLTYALDVACNLSSQFPLLFITKPFLQVLDGVVLVTFFISTVVTVDESSSKSLYVVVSLNVEFNVTSVVSRCNTVEFFIADSVVCSINTVVGIVILSFTFSVAVPVAFNGFGGLPFGGFIVISE